MDTQSNYMGFGAVLVVGLLVGAGAGYYIGFDRGWEGALAAHELEEAAEENPFAEVETNPLKDVKTNPYENVKLNPFD